jgi:hypothetical protein
METMHRSRKVLSLALAASALAVAPSAASAEQANPYTAAGVCGAGFKPIDRHNLVDGNNGILLAETVLTYNGATGQNCVVTLKRYRVGLTSKYHDHVMAEVYTRPLSTPGNIDSDYGNFKFFAGPVYVTARNKCVMWGGQSDEWAPANWVPRGDLHSAFRSGWTHCG